jgi:hypothetical protein
MCHGSGNRAKWVSLREFDDLLERAIVMEPDYLELARQQPVVSIKIAATLQVSKTDNNLFT